jgi:hypothetical protein
MYTLLLLLLLTMILILCSNHEYFTHTPGFIHKVLVERELNYWKLSKESGNLKDVCLHKMQSKDILRDEDSPPHKWMRWARKNGYEIIVFPYKPSEFDKSQYVYNELYSEAFVGKREDCLRTKLFESFHNNQEKFSHHKLYILDQEQVAAQNGNRSSDRYPHDYGST